jgi:hypothetical protein
MHPTTEEQADSKCSRQANVSGFNGSANTAVSISPLLVIGPEGKKEDLKRSAAPVLHRNPVKKRFSILGSIPEGRTGTWKSLS